MGQRQVQPLPPLPFTMRARAFVALGVMIVLTLGQRRLLAERKHGSQAKHVAEGRGAVGLRVKGVTKRTNQIDPKTGLAIGDV